MNTMVVCSKCGAASEYHTARDAGWLISPRKDKAGWMVIRCPRHVTRYARRLAGLRNASKQKKEDEMKFDVFCREFPEARLREVYNLVEAAMLAAYHGEVEIRLVQRNHALGIGYETEPSVSAFVTNEYEWWPSGLQRREACGSIEWLTSSGHRVRFVFALARNPAGWDEVDLVRVEVGDDNSEVFYPRIRALCAEVGVECVVAPLP